MKKLPVVCKFCKRRSEIDYEPNGIFSESFCQNAFVCGRCHANYAAKKNQPAPGNQLPDREFIKNINVRLPYKEA